METGEDVLASEEGASQGCSADQSSSNCIVVPVGSDQRSGRKKKLRRNVTFPDDARLVRALDPVDPWENAGHHSSVEVINAYRSTCQRMKIKPCEKLIKQLEACESFRERIDVIDLRGVKLDLKNCEALEEVFRRVRTKNLDLENTSLEDDGAVSLLEMIEYYKSTCKLNLAYNAKIKIRGWQAIGRTLKKTPCLHYLDIRNTVWTEQSIPLLGRSLRMDCCLTVLHMEGANLTGRPLYLLASAVKFNHILKDLFLGDNKLIPNDGQPLGEMLKGNEHLQLLDLRNNPLQDMGVGYICEGLAEQQKGGLQTLVLWNTQVTSQGAGYLANALVSSSSIRTLNLGHNRLTNEGVCTLKEGLLRNYSLQRLGLLSTKLTSEGMIALAEVIADSKTLLRMDLRENDPYVGGLMALSLSLKVNKTLVRIDLDKEMKKEPGMETTQRILLADIYGYCQRNKLLAKEQEESELANESHPEESVTSETDRIVNDVKQDSTHMQPHLESKVAPYSFSQLIQLETPPDIIDELKGLTADYPGSSRFTVTAVSDADQAVCEDSSEDEFAAMGDNDIPLVDLSDSNSLPDLQSSTSRGTNLLDERSDVVLLDFDSSQDPLLNPKSLPLKPTSLQTDLQTADSTSSVLAFEKELDSMLAGMTVKEANHSPVHNNAMKTQDFWRKQMEDLMKGATMNPNPPSTVSSNSAGSASADLLS